MTLYSDVEKDWWALVNEKTPEKTALDIATLFLCNETVRHTFPRAHLCFFEHAPQLDASCVALRIDQMPREAIAKYLKNTKAFCGSVDATVCSPNFYGHLIKKSICEQCSLQVTQKQKRPTLTDLLAATYVSKKQELCLFIGRHEICDANSCEPCGVWEKKP